MQDRKIPNDMQDGVSPNYAHRHHYNHHHLSFPNPIPINFQDVQNKNPDRTFYLKDKFWRIRHSISKSMSDIYQSLWTTFSFDQIDYRNIKKIVQPMMASVIGFAVAEVVTVPASRQYWHSDEYDFVFKFFLSSALLTLSMSHRITEQRYTKPIKQAFFVAIDVAAVSNMYLSTFQGTHFLLKNQLSSNANLIASLGNSFLLMPGLISRVVQKNQQRQIKKAYEKGSQRVDNAMYSSGFTSIANIYFQANHFLMTEMAIFSRIFQLGLISDNILHANTVLQQFRNCPALLVDFIPNIIKNLTLQQQKIEEDFKFNTTKESVLRFTKKGPVFSAIPRYRLRNGDFVACNQQFDFGCTPVSGEVVVLSEKDGRLIPQFEPKKYAINLKSHNGEDKWIEYKSSAALTQSPKPISLTAIHQGEQSAILRGTKLNIFQQDRFFIRIKEAKERDVSSHYQKESVINGIIQEHKKRMVYYACGSALLLALFVSKNCTDYPTCALRLLLNLFQMLIPFSENFLREMVNGRLMKKINKHLPDHPLETIDVLRLVDLCNVTSGYYQKEFPQGAAIVSDKTGTLTTSQMNVVGLYRPAKCNQQVLEQKTGQLTLHQQALEQKSGQLLPHQPAPEQKSGQLTPYSEQACFEIFAAAFTHQKKELEPEEFSIKEFFAKSNLTIEEITSRNHHLLKKLSLPKEDKQLQKSIKSYHLGLYRSLGGRLTLMEDSERKKYLIFCGIPRAEVFANMPLAVSYNQMKPREGVLSRDWCIACAPLDKDAFSTLRALFRKDQKQEIEKYVCSHPEILEQLVHYGTFLIDNPVKKSAEKFIANYRSIQVPVYIATGDTAKAAENIVRVLSPDSAQQITTIRPADVVAYGSQYFPPNSTVIFAGINEEILKIFKNIISVPTQQQPVVIFSEVSTAGKGLLASFLKENGFFVVANGDGSNDVAMMQAAHVVFAHLTEDNTYAPGVSQFANLNDCQLTSLLGVNHQPAKLSFYELLDIHKNRSHFKALLAAAANSQEKISMALLLKSIKMGFELASCIGLPAKEMWQQHWFSVGFDLFWLGISFQEINHSANLPASNQHINNNHFRPYGLLLTFSLAALEAFLLYAVYGESTNLTSMVTLLIALPFVLKSLFLNYGEVQMDIAKTHLAEDKHHVLSLESKAGGPSLRIEDHAHGHGRKMQSAQNNHQHSRRWSLFRSIRRVVSNDSGEEARVTLVDSKKHAMSS